MKKIVALIPIKMNNERLPGKNTKRFSDGTPLISFILSSLKKVSGLDGIYVFCSNEKIKEYLPDGVEYLKRDVSLDQSTTKINEVLHSFAEKVEAEYYLLSHATAPFIQPETMEKGVQAVLSGEYDSALTVEKMQDFIWKDGKPMNYSLSAIPRTQDLEPLYVETSGMYIYSRDMILEQNRRVGDRPCLVEISRIEASDIDEPVDFEIADAIYMKCLKERHSESN